MFNNQEDQTIKQVMNLCQDSSQLNEQCQKFGAPFKSYEKSATDLLSVLKMHTKGNSTQNYTHNLSNAMNLDHGAVERGQQNAIIILHNSDKTKRESQENIKHSYQEVRNFIFGKDQQYRKANQDEAFDDFRLKMQDLSLFSSIKHQYTNNATNTSSIYAKSLKNWESKQRKIPTTAELNENNNFYANSLVSYKSILNKSNKSVTEKKIRYLDFIKKYISRKPNETDQIQRSETLKNNVRSFSDVTGTAGYLDDNLGQNQIGYNPLEDDNLQFFNYQPTVPQKTAVTHLGKDISSINQDELSLIWEFLSLQSENFDQNILGLKYENSDELVYKSSDHLMKNSQRYLETTYLEMIRNYCYRGRFQYLNPNNNQYGETIDLIYGFIEEHVLDTNFVQEYYVEKDESDCPIWAVLYYCVRCGLIDLAKSIALNYSGKLKNEVIEMANYFDFDLTTSQLDMQKIETLRREKQFVRDEKDVFELMLWMIITRCSENLQEVEILLEDMASYIWFSLRLSLEEGNVDLGEENSYPMLSPRTNQLTLQEKILQYDVSKLSYLEVFKLRCLCNQHYLAQTGLINSGYSTEEITHIAIYMHETGVIHFSEVLSSCNSLEEYVNFEDIRDLSSEIVPYYQVLRNYLSDFVKDSPCDSLIYLKLLESSPKNMTDTLKNQIAGFDQIPQFFDYTQKSIENFNNLKNMFGIDLLSITLNELQYILAEQNRGHEIAFVRILEELSRFEEILQIILIRESCTIPNYRTQFSLEKRVAETNDPTYDNYLSQFLARMIKKNPSIERETIFTIIKTLKNVKIGYRTHYQVKDFKKALEMFEEYGKTLLTVDFRTINFPRELKIAYFEIVLENLKCIKDVFGTLDFRLNSYDASKSNLKERVNRLRNFFMNYLIKNVDFENEFSENLSKLREEITRELNQLDAVIQ